MKIAFDNDKWEYEYDEKTQRQYITRKGWDWYEDRGNLWLHAMAQEIERLRGEVYGLEAAVNSLSEYQWMYNQLED